MSADCGESRRVGGVESCLQAMLDQVGFQEAIHPAPGVAPEDAAEDEAHVPQREAAERPWRETGVLRHPGEGPSPIFLIRAVAGNRQTTSVSNRLRNGIPGS